MEDELRQLREIATDLLSSKGQTTAVKSLAAKGLLSLLRVRSEHKKLAYASEELKEDTSKAKCSLEQADLALQNLLYEKQYYEKEIRSCRNFQSAYPDALVALQPVEEFWSSADEDLRAKATEQGSDHALMLQRLAHEMRMRKKMAKDLEDLKQSKSALLQQVSEQEKVLKQLQGNLKSLDDTAKPIVNVLSGYPSLRNTMSRSSVELLPVALFVLCSQLAASKEALGLPINVSIVGPVEEAVALAEQVAAEALEGGSSMPSTSATVSDPNNETMRTSKRPRIDGPSPSDDTYKAHPLSVDVEIFRGDGSAASASGSKGPMLLTVRFQYLLNLRLVTACCDDASDNQLLGALFPLDDGSALPSEAMAQLENGTFQFDPCRPAKPYRWCQHLAGIDIIPSLPLLSSQLQASEHAQLTDGLTGYRKQQRVVTVVGRLQAVKDAQLALNSCLATMLKNPVPSSLSKYTRTPLTTITTWELSSGGSGNKAAAAAAAARLAAAGARSRAVTPQIPVSGTATPVVFGIQAASGTCNGQQHGEAGNGNAMQGNDEGVKDMLGQLNAGLDEGEIPGSPAPSTLQMQRPQDDAGLEYQLQQVLSPGPGPALPNFFSYEPSPEPGSIFGGEAGAAASASTCKPPMRTYRCVLRCRQIEVEVLVRLYLEYPVRPPLLTVQAVRELPREHRKGAPKELPAVNDRIVMEQEANITAVCATPAGCANETLLYQLLHLRLCIDDFANQHMAEAGPASKDMDLASQLAARQKLRGRDRRPPVPIVEDGSPGLGA